MKNYYYEGKLSQTVEGGRLPDTLAALEEAMQKQSVWEGICYLCDSEQNLHIHLGEIEGIIPKNEGAEGVEEGKVKDIALISKVGKPIQFVVQNILKKEERPTALLSRRAVQERCNKEYLSHLQCGDMIEVKVTHLERFGAFVDIGAGINSLIPIDMLSVSRIAHPAKRVKEGDVLRCAVRSKENGKITLSLREMLGTWEENAAHFCAGQTVKGVVRSVESYGVFIELAPNLAGLSEFNPYVREGEEVSVYIKAILPEKMKIKLSIIDILGEEQRQPLHFFFSGEHMDVWRYSPAGCSKVIQTVF